MDYQLIPDDIYDTLPEEPEEKLALLAKTAQVNLNRFIDEDSSRDFIDEIRQQFIETMRAVAEALDIEGLPSASSMSELSTYQEYRLFSTKLSAIITKVKLQSELVPRPYSVKLGRINKAKIRQEVAHLRSYIEQSEFSDKKKIALGRHMDKLEAELEKNRMSFSQLAAITAAVATTFAGSTATIAKAPEAYSAITSILAAIGDDKEKEDAEHARLAPPPKALPAPPARPTAFGGFSEDLDDDVPF